MTERKKIDANPRVKNREKFRKAQIRVKGQVRGVQAQVGAYTGEATGIKKSVSNWPKRVHDSVFVNRRGRRGHMACRQ